MAVSRFSACALSVLILIANEMYLESAEAVTINVKFPIQHSTSFSAENVLETTSGRISSWLLSSGTPLSLWGTVRSEDVAAVCQQISTSANLTFTVTAVLDEAGHQEDLTIKIESFRGCDSSHDDAETEAVIVDDFGHRSLIHCSKKDGLRSCEVYQTSSAIAMLRGSRGRMLRHGCNGVLTCLCFPGDALVQLANGEQKPMMELNVGDQVAVRKPDGLLAYEAVYAFGHKEAKVVTEFIKITLSPTTAGYGARKDAKTHRNLRTLELSATHFVPTASSGAGGHMILHKRAEEVKVGDFLWASTRSIYDGQEILRPFVVEEIGVTRKAGLYNPYTMGGTIVVNGVVASSHSEWILDDLFDFLRITHLLPVTYQTIFAPPRMLYRLIGKEAYVRAYTWLDLHFNLVSIVNDYSLSTLTILVASALAGPSCILFLASTKKN